MAKKPLTPIEQGRLNRLLAGPTLTAEELNILREKVVTARRAFLEANGYPTTGLPRQEPLAPRGKTESSGGIRIPLRSQQSFAKGTTRRKGDK